MSDAFEEYLSKELPSEKALRRVAASRDFHRVRAGEAEKKATRARSEARLAKRDRGCAEWSVTAVAIAVTAFLFVLMYVLNHLP